jgi:glycerophosphoryl diester phosphodiesterase
MEVFNMKIIAHRGFSGKYPENTLLAFEKAVEASSDAIELDVQLTKDGTLVLFHDDTFRRLIQTEGFLLDHTFPDLEQYQIRKRLFNRTVYAPILSLESYFNWAQDRDIMTVIELKNNLRPHEGMEEKLVSLTKKFKLEHRVIFSSFQKDSVLKLKALAPLIPCAYITKLRKEEDLSWIESAQIEFIHPKFTSLWPWNIAKLKKLGVRISPWTVNHPLFMWYLLHIPNLYGMITDRPDRLKKVLQRKRKT